MKRKQNFGWQVHVGKISKILVLRIHIHFEYIEMHVNVGTVYNCFSK